MANWLQRSTAPGVLLANNFSDFERDVKPFRYANAPDPPSRPGLIGGPVWEERIGRVVSRVDEQGRPCLRINIVPAPAGQVDNQGQAWRGRLVPGLDSDGIGSQHLWIDFGLKIPPSRLVPWRTLDATGALWAEGGPLPKIELNNWKFVIVANLSTSTPYGNPGAGQSSNSLSHVLTTKSNRGGRFPVCYAHNDVSRNGAPFEGLIPGVLGSNDIDLSPGWDRGAQFTNYLDRYCCYSNPRGCPLWPTDVIVKFRAHIRVQTWGGTAGNIFESWWALPGDTKFTLLQSHHDYLVGTNEWPWVGGFNGIHLTPFETDRTDSGGVATWMDYYDLLVSTQEPAFPDDAEERPGTQPQGGEVVGTGTFIISKDAADTVEEVEEAAYDAIVAQAAQVEPLSTQLAASTAQVQTLTAQLATATTQAQTLAAQLDTANAKIAAANAALA